MSVEPRNKPLGKIVFVVNQSKKGATDLSFRLREIAKGEGVECTETKGYPPCTGCMKDADACFVIGGDGTLLGTVAEAVREDVPVLGVNMGHLGFLATFTVEEALKCLPKVLAGFYEVGERSLLRCSSALGEQTLALNDVVIRSVSSRLAHLSVSTAREHVINYSSDGLIVSTPTGSTAYNLSAGGPLIHPTARVLALTPICPHSLSNRALVFDSPTTLRIALNDGDQKLRVTIDGRTTHDRVADFPLTVNVARETFKIIHDQDYSYFQVVHEKLRWGHMNR